MSQPIPMAGHPRQRSTSKSESYALRSRNALPLSEPFPILADQFVEVKTEHMAGYFKGVRRSLIKVANQNREDESEDAADIILEDDFILVCRFITRCRVERVFNIFCRINDGSTILSPDFRMPESLARIINRIGVVTVQGGAYRVCPKSEDIPPDPSGFLLTELINAYLVEEFDRLVTMAVGRGENMKTVQLADSIEGTSWWFVTARSVGNANTAMNGEANTVLVEAAHKEWAKGDGTICATIRNQYNGLLPVESMMKYTLRSCKIADMIDMPPIPMVWKQYVPFEVDRMDAYFAALRRTLVNAVSPFLQPPDKAETISEADFICVCRWVTFARVTRVFEGHLRKSPSTLLPEPYIPIPKGLCEILNGIGLVWVHDGDYLVVPEPKAKSRVPPTGEAMLKFADLVESARKRGFISTSTVSSSIDGSSWWLLSARSAESPNVIAAQWDKVTVFGSHKEWTVLDGFYCALVQNQFDGVLPIEKTLKWCIGTFSSVPALRTLHNLPACVRRVHEILPKAS